jgi:hypothetical protein
MILITLVGAAVLATAAFFYGQHIGGEIAEAKCAEDKRLETLRQVKVSEEAARHQKELVESIEKLARAREQVREEIINAPPSPGSDRECLDADSVRRLNRIK